MGAGGSLGAYPRTLREVGAFLAQDRTPKNPKMLQAPGGLTVLVLATVRLGQYCHRGRGLLPHLMKPAWALVDRLFLRFLFEAQISPDLLCGPGLHVQHRMRLVTIDPGVVIGSDVTLLGDTKLIRTAEGSPTIGSHAFIATRCAIIGPAVLGSRARVGMGSVVIDDVPEGRVARGMPAALVEVAP
jgi:serine O-acetyltransferase